jgi:hypothetical protein
MLVDLPFHRLCRGGIFDAVMDVSSISGRAASPACSERLPAGPKAALELLP